MLQKMLKALRQEKKHIQELFNSMLFKLQVSVFVAAMLSLPAVTHSFFLFLNG
jgi:Sec-independent protein secretion pathway component TatC